MKTILTLIGLVTLGTILHADPPQRTVEVPPVPQPPPPVTILPGQPAAPGKFVYNQQPLAAPPMLLTPEQAKSIMERFREGYKKLGEPRLLIYVNRELVDEKSGFKLAARTERTSASQTTYTGEHQKAAPGNLTITAGGNVNIQGNDGPNGKGAATTKKTDGDNIYNHQPRPEPALADKQTVRDLERLFGRPLRNAGAKLADQRVATQLIASKPLKDFITPIEGQQAEKDRAALKNVADVVIEILISSRNVTVAEVSGDKVYASPDIQATAIRLSDARIIGQASSSDIIGKSMSAGQVLRNFDVNQISEATALALMEDMLVSAP